MLEDHRYSGARRGLEGNNPRNPQIVDNWRYFPGMYKTIYFKENRVKQDKNQFPFRFSYENPKDFLKLQMLIDFSLN